MGHVNITSKVGHSRRVIRQHSYGRAHCTYNQRVEVYIACLLKSP